MDLQFHTFIDNTESFEYSDDSLISYITIGKNYIHYTILAAKKEVCLLCKGIFAPVGVIGQSEFDNLLADRFLRNSIMVHIAIDTTKHILVPKLLLSETNYAAYFSSIFEIEIGEEIMVEKINEEITELYVVKIATLNYLKNEFNKVRFYSNSACLLKSYFSIGDQMNGQQKIFIHAEFDTFTLTFFKEKKLQFLQSFEMIGASDVLYCLLNALQIHQVDMSTVDIYLSGFSNTQNQIADLISAYFQVKAIDFATSPTEIPALADFPIHILYNQFSLISCAS